MDFAIVGVGIYPQPCWPAGVVTNDNGIVTDAYGRVRSPSGPLATLRDIGLARAAIRLESVGKRD
jgi:hypothetical protein